MSAKPDKMLGGHAFLSSRPTCSESSVSFGIPDDFKELVRDRTNLVDLVSESVQLQSVRGGQDYVGLCPFHEDRNPSMHVYPDRNGGSYRCWVCQHGGDCYSWVQESSAVRIVRIDLWLRVMTRDTVFPNPCPRYALEPSSFNISTYLSGLTRLHRRFRNVGQNRRT